MSGEEFSSDELAGKWESAINDAWNSQAWNVNGCNVKFNITVKNGEDAPNNITVGPPGLGKRSYVFGFRLLGFLIGGSSGKCYQDDAEWVAPHETGHLMELGDRYFETKPFTKPHPGWEKNVMAEQWGTVESRNVEEILESRKIKCDC